MAVKEQPTPPSSQPNYTESLSMLDTTLSRCVQNTSQSYCVHVKINAGQDKCFHIKYIKITLQ